MTFRKMWVDYRSEFVFGLVLFACVLLSLWGVQFIAVDFYQNSLSHILDGCIETICLAGAWLLARHHKGVRVRKLWIGILLAYAAFTVMLLMHITTYVGVPRRGLVCLENWEILVGNFMLWILLLYPTAVLRPGWLTLKRAILQGLPVWIAFALDEIFDIDLRILLAIYPMLLVFFLVTHIRKYRKWCEENYSSMDAINVQWIIRYIIMYLFDCLTFSVLCFFSTIPIAVTQQWLLLLLLVYSTEQVLFREDPWVMVRRAKCLPPTPEENEEETPQAPFSAYRAALEEWMDKEKPYTNPEFRLLDMRQVLPLNRTYLSQLINNEYGCNFYQYVTNYRIEEAKRLMKENPTMQLQEVGELSGFSSPTVFSRVFSRETGMTPREWNTKFTNS